MKESNQIPPFYSGQWVVANCNFDMLVKDKYYQVEKCFWNCCKWSVVLVQSPIAQYKNGNIMKIGDIFTCHRCGEVNVNKDSKHPYLSTRFSPLEEMRFPVIKLSKKEELVIEFCEN